jgi:hypothetical protein
MGDAKSPQRADEQFFVREVTASTNGEPGESSSAPEAGALCAYAPEPEAGALCAYAPEPGDRSSR